MKQKELAKWLKIVVIIFALMGLVFGSLVATSVGKDAVALNPELSYMYIPCLIFIWITAIPYYIALLIAWRIFSEISKDNSFCMENAARLKYICYFALTDSVLYFIAAVILLIMNLLHPGILLMLLLIIFIGGSIGIASAALSHLVEKAASMKQENDLTI